MTPQAIYDMCLEAEARYQELRDEGIDLGEAFLVLTIQCTSCPRGEQVRLAGISGPYGDLINWQDEEATGRWKTKKVKEFLLRYFGGEIECQ